MISPCTFYRPPASPVTPPAHAHGCSHTCRCALPTESTCAHCAMAEIRLSGHETGSVLLARWPAWGPRSQDALETVRTHLLYERSFVNTGRMTA